MGVTELESEGSFPQEMRRLDDLAQKIKESNLMKTHFGANISDSMNNLKASIVKAEAALMIGDIEAMKKSYAVVQQENGSLIGEYLKRTNNHQQLIQTLKELNQMIKSASNLRIGNA